MLSERLRRPFKVAPHVNLRDELFAHRDSERLKAELDETRTLIKRVGGGISVRDRELHELNAATSLGVFKRCQDNCQDK